MAFPNNGGKCKLQSHQKRLTHQCINKIASRIVKKVKIVLYTLEHRGVPVREDTYPEPSASKVGWPVSFLYLPSVANGYPFAAG